MSGGFPTAAEALRHVKAGIVREISGHFFFDGDERIILSRRVIEQAHIVSVYGAEYFERLRLVVIHQDQCVE